MTHNWQNSIKAPRSSGLALMVGLFVLSAMALPQSRLLSPRKPELKAIETKLNRKLLPDGATQLKVESKQVFNLVSKTRDSSPWCPYASAFPSREPIGDCARLRYLSASRRMEQSISSGR